MIRKSKRFSWPRKLYDKPRILDENKLVEKYGLKNKREIWKTEAKVNYFRSRAKSLITSPAEEQQIFFGNLNKIGLNVNSIAEVLALNKENLLKRRLSSVLVAKKLATTHKQARQMIVHKKIIVNGAVVDAPSYLVPIKEENSISIKNKIRKPKIEEKTNEGEVPEAENSQRAEGGK